MEDKIHSLATGVESATSVSGRPVWILRTERSSYAMGIDTHGFLQHMWWGENLPLTEDFGEPQSLSAWSHERSQGVSQEEYPAWGDLKFGEPGIKATFHDGTRATTLEYQTATINDNYLELRLCDLHYQLQVSLCYEVFPSLDIIVRSVRLTNESDHPLTLNEVCSALWRFPGQCDYQLSYLTGKWGEDFQKQTMLLTPGKHILESRRGITGFDSNPFFAVHETRVSESSGRVYFGVHAYSGSWQFVTEHNSHGQISLSGGVNPFDFNWRLDPGETFETPKFIAGYTAYGLGEASRLLHRYHRQHTLPKAFADTIRPVLYNSWYVTEFDVSLENQLAAARVAADLGVELFVMDDGWFGKRDNDRAGLGDWYPSKSKFPNGLAPLIKEVNDLGMDFGIWVEPEMVNPDSDLYREHPDWVYHFPNRTLSQRRNQLVLNLARADVQDYLKAVLSKLLTEHNIKFIKWDMNRPFSEPGWTNAPEGRAQEIWVRHARAVYDILKTLRAQHPDVLFETCASGGGRVDYGIFEYTDQAWMSDNTDSLADLYITESYSLAYALKTRVVWVTDPSNLTNRTIPLDFRFHVAMLGTMGIGANLPLWKADELEDAKRHIETYKRLRHVIQHGHFYRLTPVTAHQISAFQFVSENGKEVVVFAFLGHTKYNAEKTTIRLQGLASDAIYQVGGTNDKISGQALMARGVRVNLNGDYSSQLIELSSSH